MHIRVTTKQYNGETYHYASLIDSEIVNGKKKPVVWTYVNTLDKKS